MISAGFNILITGCDSITKKKLKLYREKNPGVQLFFCEDEPAAEPCAYDLYVLPAGELAGHIREPGYSRLKSPPILAFGTDVAMHAAIAAGCADYLCEPWGPPEFFERARRCCCDAALLKAGAYTLAAGAGRLLLFSNDETLIGEVSPPASEYELFRLFTRNRGRFFTRSLLSELLGYSRAEGSRSADMHVSRLRKRINTLLTGAGASVDDNPVITHSGRGWGISL